MGKIHVLDQITIDKIAAGEVIERPASIAKELVENAIDAGATAIVVEIKEGGISFLRITDNGCGIAKEDVRNAFLRHSTSKITSAEDLSSIHSLGFRGEALSSISAVSQVEMITKPEDSTFGISYRIEGGKEVSLDDTGAPNGTTFLVRQLFYNTPARRKFLKTPMTEASHVADLVTRLALSHPEISFQFINNNQSKIHTSGNGNLKDVIYHIYGRDIASHLLKTELIKGNLRVRGYIGEPVITRGNRNFENYFINGRYIKSNIVSKAIEDAYKDFTMQHKYPFTVLHIDVDTEMIDVNVHPTKMEIRFGNAQEVYNFIYEAVSRSLHGEELIPVVAVPEPPKQDNKQDTKQVSRPVVKAKDTNPVEITSKKQSEVGEKQSVLYGGASAVQNPLYKKQSAVGNLNANKSNPSPVSTTNSGKKDLDYFMNRMKERVTAYHSDKNVENVPVKKSEIVEAQVPKVQPAVSQANEKPAKQEPAKQLNLFEEKLLDASSVKEHKIIGQVFDTYWLVEFKDNLYIIDQHAAHERVLYEKTLHGMKTREYTSQNISPPIILELSMKEVQMLETYMDQFTRIGFEFENFGPDSYAVCAIPDNLYGVAKKELLMEMIDSMSDEIYTGLTPDTIDEKIASMSCKAAVKGNMRLSAAEADALIGELLALDNPYHCPHGRPTIISMTKREMEKKFKRIV